MRTVFALLLICNSAAHAATEAEALFLQGANANREGRFAAATPLLLKAEALGYRNPEIDFELGWAAMGAGQPQTCVDRLERFEAAAPGRGQASEFLGRCYLALRQPDKAEAMFKQALARDPRLAPTVDLAMATLEQSRGRTEAARARMESVASADSPTGRALRDLAGPPDPAIQPDKPLRLSASFSLGHNSNVIGLGNTMPLPADISRKSADFTRLTAGASYTRQFDPATSATLGYAALVDRYDAIGGANMVDHFLYADFFRQVTARVGFSLRLSGELTDLAGSRFRDVVGIRPALSYRFSSDAVTEVAYAYSDSTYKTQVAQVFSRDGEAHALSLTHSFRLRGTNWSGAIGATLVSNRTEGSDFQSGSVSATGTLRYTFPNRIVAAVGAGATRDDYRNPNSLAGAGFAFARADRQNVVSGQLAGPLSEKLRWFVQAQKLRNQSNIPFFEYRQSVVSAGIAADF